MDLIQSVNWLDVVIFVILIMSIWVGFARGFLHELIASMHWVVAFFGVYYFSNSLMEVVLPYASPYLKQLPLLTEEQKNTLFAILFDISLFLLLLLLSQLIFGFFAKPIRHRIFGSINHALGALIGLIKGLIVLAFIWMPLRTLNLDILVSFQQTSNLIPLVDISADLLAPLWDIFSQKLAHLLANL